MKRASGQTLKVAVYSTAAGSVAATAAAAMQWAVLGLLHAFDQDTVPGLLNVAAYTAYLLWVSLFALVAYLIVMIAAGLPLLFLAARMGMRGPLAATSLGALALTTIVTAILAATTANRLSDLVFIGGQQILPGAAAGLAVWIVTRKPSRRVLLGLPERGRPNLFALGLELAAGGEDVAAAGGADGTGLGYADA